MPRSRFGMVLTIGVLVIVGQAVSATLDRERDPVVLTGAELAPLLGWAVDEMVAFRHAGQWQQIPVQVDERKQVDFGVVYNQPPVGLTLLAYADPLTYTGADPDPAFDADDELVFMAGDAGDRAPTAAGLPAGVSSSAGIELEIADPLDSGVAFVYLFRSDTLTPDAGADYVSYQFNLLAGDYIPDYGTVSGPNPEDSEASTAFYRTHFADRWVRDELEVYVGGADGADILDRHKNLFAPGICTRTEDTFSNGEGAFFTNKDGPVRAIRSYMGANSGPFTQREHLFYERRQDLTTFLRVHAIAGIMDLYDYSPAAAGMTYYSDLNLAGVAVDGVPDAVSPGPITWEMVTGPQGSIVIAHATITDIAPFAYTSYYADDVNTAVTQCTGDAFAYATSGIWIDHSIPNTDPSRGEFKVLESRRTIYYEPPGRTVADAQGLVSRAATPLEITGYRYPPAPGDYDRDDDVDGDDFELFVVCNEGPQVPLPPGCSDRDFDGDNDSDQVDYGFFQRCYSGTGGPADLACAD